jgi:hypothetical protein
MLKMSGLKLCPAIADVFYNEHEQYSKHFKPLAEIDLSLINQAWIGKIFVVYFNDDPYCEESVKYLNDFCDGDKVTFDIIEGKYKFKADFGYFITNEDWKEWLLKGNSSYNEFLKKLKTVEIDPASLIMNLGEEPDWIQSDETPLNSKGQKMQFICQMDSGDIVEDFCEEMIYLFFDPIDQVAVQVHQID